MRHRALKGTLEIDLMYVLDITARSFYSKKPSEQIVEIKLITNDVNTKLTMLQSCIFIS